MTRWKKICTTMIAAAMLGAITLPARTASAADVNVQIVNLNSGQCMTVLGDLKANGSKVSQATCKKAPGQIWVWVLASLTYRYNLYNPNSGKCLDTTWNRDRAQMAIYDCGGLPNLNTNQVFGIFDAGSGTQTIRPLWNVGGKCIGVAGASTVPHTAVVFANCDGSRAQRWYRSYV